MTHLNNFVAGIFFTVIFFWIVRRYVEKNDYEEDISEADVWLQEHNLSQYKALFRKKGVDNILKKLFANMRWHEMAIDQAELESKIDCFRRDASKVEELFEQYVSFDKKAKGFANGIWPFPWFYEKIKKISTKSPLEELLRVLAFNAEIYNSIAIARQKLDRNTEIESESDIMAAKSLRRSLTECEMVLNEIEGRFAKFDKVFQTEKKSSSELSAPEENKVGKNIRIFTLISCAELNHLSDIDLVDSEKLHQASDLLKKQLILKQWLTAHNIKHLYPRVLRTGFTSLDDIFHLENPEDVSDSIHWVKAKESLPSSKNDFENMKLILWSEILKESNNEDIWEWSDMLMASFTVGSLIVFAIMAPSYFMPKAKPSLLQFVTGKYLQPSNCKICFEWEDPKTVGETFVFKIEFYQRNGHAYPICDTDNLNVEVSEGNRRIATICQIGGCEPSQANIAKIKFTARRSGVYRIAVQIGGCHIRGSPFFKNFSPGPPDPKKTQLLKHSSIVVCTAGLIHALAIEPRDEFNNLCLFKTESSALEGYRIVLRKPESSDMVFCDITFHYDEITRRIEVALKFANEGCFHATIFLNEFRLYNGDFDVIVLNSADTDLVQRNVASKNHEVCYEARLLSIQEENLHKPKKVFCYISPKQVIVKEFLLKFIPKRLLTFRLCPSTKFYFHGDNNQCSMPTFAIDDGCQPKIELASSDRNVIAATFTHFLLQNIGGSETFKDKQDFFYHEIRKFHQKHHHDKAQIKVNRNKLLESSLKATKNFSVSDWCRNFEITFQGEQGLDWGGVRREWFTLVCAALFDARNELFMSFSDNQQALVHPNPKRPSHLKLKHFEFAGKIVGKCLYESALGGKFRLLVRARFTRSFLAQVIGLRIHYKYFEQDDPDLYLNKIKYIEEHDVDEMDLYFVEEEYSGNGQVIKTAELTPGGSKIRVSNDTKHRYLDYLAQYKLASTVKAEVDHFLKGLNELVPDSLLSIFDENELELLLCGTGEYDIADFKANHIVNGSSLEFRRVLEWFWAAVSNFTVEEMARLLQFTTGCSQLPPGGFQELTPKFTLTAAPTFGNLPTAHTCFNQLCLPDYDSYEQFEKALLLAIKEGSEGFGFG